MGSERQEAYCLPLDVLRWGGFNMLDLAAELARKTECEQSSRKTEGALLAEGLPSLQSKDLLARTLMKVEQRAMLL